MKTSFPLFFAVASFICLLFSPQFARANPIHGEWFLTYEFCWPKDDIEKLRTGFIPADIPSYAGDHHTATFNSDNTYDLTISQEGETCTYSTQGSYRIEGESLEFLNYTYVTPRGYDCDHEHNTTLPILSWKTPIKAWNFVSYLYLINEVGPDLCNEDEAQVFLFERRNLNMVQLTNPYSTAL